MDQSSPQRPIDENVNTLQRNLKSRFSYVSKARANVWVTTGVTLFVLGIVVGGLAISQKGGVSSNAALPRFKIEAPSIVTAGQSNGFVIRALGSNGPITVNWGDGTPLMELIVDRTGRATATHSYAQAGAYTMTTQALFTNADKPRSTSLAITVTEPSSSQAITAESLLSISLDSTTPSAANVDAGQTDVPFTTVRLVAGQTDITVKVMTVIAKAQSIFQNLGKISVYADDTLLGSGSFEAGDSTSIRISLGAGITIPANSSSKLMIKADTLSRAVGGPVALGVDSLETQPQTSIGGSLPVLGNMQTLKASGYLGPPIKR